MVLFLEPLEVEGREAQFHRSGSFDDGSDSPVRQASQARVDCRAGNEQLAGRSGEAFVMTHPHGEVLAAAACRVGKQQHAGFVPMDSQLRKR